MSDRLERFRRNKDEFYKTQLDSPLRADQKRSFSKLDYFPENPDLVFKLRIDRNAISHDP